MLAEDRSRFDWPGAFYRPEVRTGDGHASIHHRIDGGQALLEIVERGDAAWAAEVRCPSTLLSFLRVANDGSSFQRLDWSREDMHDEWFVLPGLLAVRDCSFESDDLGSLWRGRRINAPAGWWLARGRPVRGQGLRQSLLRFVRAPDLDAGTMEVVAERDEGLRFAIRLADDAYDGFQDDRNLQVAGLIAACSLFKETFEDGVEEHFGVVREVRRRLEDAQVAAWDEDGWNPARAATAIERFVFPEGGGAGE